MSRPPVSLCVRGHATYAELEEALDDGRVHRLRLVHLEHERLDLFLREAADCRDRAQRDNAVRVS